MLIKKAYRETIVLKKQRTQSNKVLSFSVTSIEFGTLKSCHIDMSLPYRKLKKQKSNSLIGTIPLFKNKLWA